MSTHNLAIGTPRRNRHGNMLCLSLAKFGKTMGNAKKRKNFGREEKSEKMFFFVRDFFEERESIVLKEEDWAYYSQWFFVGWRAIFGSFEGEEVKEEGKV